MNCRKRQLKMVFQDETSECALACLTMVANFYGANTTISKLRMKYPIPTGGISVKNIKSICQQIGLNARILRCSLEGILFYRKPILMHWDMQHFVVLKTVKNGSAVIYDPARGVRKLSLQEVSNHFTGIIIDITPNQDFQPINDASRLSLLEIIGSLAEYKKPVAQVVFLSFFMELFMLMQPYLFKYYLDQLGTHDVAHTIGWMGLTLAFVALSLTITTFIRDYTVIQLGSMINFNVNSNVFSKMIELPLQFFEKRQIGQVIERYRIVDEIQQFMSSTIPLAIIDGAITTLTIILIFCISLPLGVLALATAITYCAIRVLSKNEIIYREIEHIHASGEAAGHVIETLKSIYTTKINSIENSRFKNWLHLYSLQINSSLKYRLLESILSSSRVLISALNTSIFILICAWYSHSGEFSTGLIFAAIFYNSHFLFRSTQFVDRVNSLLILNSKVNRIEDIYLSDPECHSDQVTSIGKLKGGITAKDISYTIEGSEHHLLQSVDIDILPGEFVVISGVNGAGKTTLMRILLGFNKFSSGTITYDDIQLCDANKKAIRKQIGCVTQDEQLYVGSIAENISLFDSRIDFERVIEVAEIAGVRECIERLPMGYSTQLGDMGTLFSEGEKQKISLARALYKNPSILMLDEGTANLDAGSEIGLLKQLKAMPCTKIVIAHRPAALDFADTIFVVEDGRVYRHDTAKSIRLSQVG